MLHVEVSRITGDPASRRTRSATWRARSVPSWSASPALLYADRASGRVISETVWRDPQALAASRSAAAAGEAAAAAALNGVIGASGEYRLVFGSARPA